MGRVANVEVIHESNEAIYCWTDSGDHYRFAVEHFSRLTTQKYCVKRRSADFGDRRFPSGDWKVTYGGGSQRDGSAGAIFPGCQQAMVQLPGLARLECVYGPDNGIVMKKKYADKRAEGQNRDHPEARKQRCQVYTSRKVDCPACILAKEVYVVRDSGVSMLSAVESEELRNMVNYTYKLLFVKKWPRDDPVIKE